MYTDGELQEERGIDNPRLSLRYNTMDDIQHNHFSTEEILNMVTPRQEILNMVTPRQDPTYLDKSDGILFLDNPNVV